MLPTTVQNIELPSYTENKITSHQIKDLVDEYLILLFYPYDFTFVCPTELNKFSELKSEFAKHHCNIAFVSCDSVYSHKSWAELSKDKGGVEPAWPMLSDYTKSFTESLLLNRPDGACQRATVIVDKELNIKYFAVNHVEIGRSSNELLRIVKALRHNRDKKQVCTVNWDE